MNNCRFCDRVNVGDFDFANEHAVAFPDIYPLSAGHTLVIPRLHEADLFELDAATRAAVWQLVDTVQSHIAETLAPDGFNIGVNVRSRSRSDGSARARSCRTAHGRRHLRPSGRRALGHPGESPVLGS
jgi:diadenosine tetraphosphate (Ap4A) HIT family hydrolase